MCVGDDGLDVAPEQHEHRDLLIHAEFDPTAAQERQDQVHAEGLTRELPQPGNLLPYEFRRKTCRPENPETSRIRDGSCQLRAGSSAYSGREDGMLTPRVRQRGVRSMMLPALIR